MCKFNPMAFATTDKYEVKNRPALAGVRYENGYQVATDSHILCALKASYSDELEGRTLMKDGTTNDGRFPRWRDIIPTRDGKWLNLRDYTEYEIDLAKISEFVRDAKQLKRNEKLFPAYVPMYVKIGDTYFKLEWFEKIASLMKYLGTNKIFLSRFRAAFISKGENYGLIMPAFFNGKENEQVDGLYLNRVYTLV